MHSSQQEDLLLNFLMDVHLRAGGGTVFGHKNERSPQRDGGPERANSPKESLMELAIGIAAMPSASMTSGTIIENGKISNNSHHPRRLMIKPDPDISLLILLQNPHAMAECREPVRNFMPAPILFLLNCQKKFCL
jgi:hypothetical protein